MKFTTENELQNFDFKDAYISDIRFSLDNFMLYLDNVKILPSNSTNRDIRTMRTNNLILTLEKATITSFINEGYKVYNADGKLLKTVNDSPIPEENYKQAVNELISCTINNIEQTDDKYTISIDTEDHTYLLTLTSQRNLEDWNKYFNL
ncbi:hypothetical protein [Lachnobacterium bovis]|uniref:Subtilin biosynthesis sensor protein SpaK n=1 Tax=Lachnobacterium bovis TaxID=140626 RepID=A0A1H9THQ4_9FIRM|nr:hypothetical protein [Lachnobacterium bovis]SER96626.1 hypothetical protein SAMN02910429_01635 [Lachnobacterium bovis]